MAKVFPVPAEVDPIEVAYAAGLFDGEGSITVARHGELSARIQMGDRECVERLFAAFPGNCNVRYNDKRVCKDGTERRVMHQLVFNGYRALWFLEIILPEMRNTRQIAKIKWLLKNWDSYATSKSALEQKKPPRWQMYIDFHEALPGKRKKPLDRYKKDIEAKRAHANFPGNAARLARRRANYKKHKERLKCS